MIGSDILPCFLSKEWLGSASAEFVDFWVVTPFSLGVGYKHFG
jgi:hypothetical protein